MELQVDDIDTPLRNVLWSAVHTFFFPGALATPVNSSGDYGRVLKRMWLHFFKLPIDIIPTTWWSVYEQVREQFYTWKWYEVYDFIEAFAQELKEDDQDLFKSYINMFLKQEMSAYRFIGDTIGPITSEVEIEAIEKALAD